MAIRDIITVPNEVLRRKSHKVTAFDKEMQKLVDDMVQTLREAPGVGLAAPQIAVPLRLIVVEYEEDDEKEDSPKRLYVVANPEITDVSEETELGIEGCLSIPGLVGEVERSLEIVVRGQNRHGKPVKIKARGWLARIFQHEIDHLDGVLYTDRAVRIWKPSPEEEALAAD